jgi:hypothetical protein
MTNYRSCTNFASIVSLFFAVVSFAQVKSDSIPLAPSCTNPIQLVTPLCDFNNDGNKDLWVVGAYYNPTGNNYIGIWYGIYSVKDKSYIYYRNLGSSVVVDIQQASASCLDSNTIVTFNGSILTYSTLTLLKKN